MFVKITVECDNREVGNFSQELSGTPTEIEESLRTLCQRVGRGVLSRALQEFAEAVPAPTCCGERMRNYGFRSITVRSTFGEIPISRRRYRCLVCDRELYPADGHLCCHGHHVTQPLAKKVCQLATVEHFTRLPELIAAQHGVTLNHEDLVELVHDMGTMANERRMAAAAPLPERRVAPPAEFPAPKTLYVSCDGIMYCTNQTEPHPDHPGEKRLIWQQMKVGCVYWQDDKERWHKQMIWGRESPELFGAALWRLACRYGYEGAQEKIFAADGGSWCWEIRAKYFSDSTGILDWYHAGEHVWDAAKKIAGDSPGTWADRADDQLRDGGGESLLTWLRASPVPSDEPARLALGELINYVATKVHYMNYPDYRGRKWQIGSGMIESTCKQLVGQRLKGPGMHWSELGALAVTALRAIDLNGKWNAFWNGAAVAI